MIYETLEAAVNSIVNSLEELEQSGNVIIKNKTKEGGDYYWPVVHLAFDISGGRNFNRKLFEAFLELSEKHGEVVAVFATIR